MSQIPLISVIDDDEAVRVATETLIRSFGYGVRTFASAEDFLKSTALSETSCIITDIHMPGMNGAELRTYLVAQGHDVPMIFMTAFPDDRICQRTRAAEVAGFLSKPFDCRAMMACIDKALGRDGG